MAIYELGQALTHLSQELLTVASGLEAVLKEFLGGGCATRTLEPLSCTRAGSAEFCYPVPE